MNRLGILLVSLFLTAVSLHAKETNDTDETQRLLDLSLEELLQVQIKGL